MLVDLFNLIFRPRKFRGHDFYDYWLNLSNRDLDHWKCSQCGCIYTKYLIKHEEYVNDCDSEQIQQIIEQ